MQYFATSGAADKQKSGCVLVGVFADGTLSPAAQLIDDASKGTLSALGKQHDLPEDIGSTLLLTDVKGIAPQRVLLVGLGKEDKLDSRGFRKAWKAACKALTATAATDALSYLGEAQPDDEHHVRTVRWCVEDLEDAMYRFDELKSRSNRSKPAKLKKLGFGTASRAAANAAEKVARQGAAIAAGASLARDLANRPANVCTPTHLADQARELAKKYKSIKTEVLSEAQMKRMGMGALLSVTAGSVTPAHLIVMRYTGAPAKEQPIALVGKGITFDTGGISIKPAPAMDEMKYDMGGAASVIGTLLTLARLKLPLNVVGVVPTCENMPSATATKPGDIVTTMSGQTVEILNTDAEGRLILCDALTYVQKKYKPRAIVDIATLTGACVIALGHHYSGLMSTSDDLAQALLDAGETAGDVAWRLPVSEDYFPPLKSNFADFANVGGRAGGAITAACFLSQFTKSATWAHLDIAGTAWESGSNKRASGRPVPLLSQYLIDQA